MPHALMQKHELSPFTKPLLLSLRYRCGCAKNEVLTIQTVFDLDVTEEHFIWTVRQLYRDLRFEAEQHLKQK